MPATIHPLQVFGRHAQQGVDDIIPKFFNLPSKYAPPHIPPQKAYCLLISHARTRELRYSPQLTRMA